MDSLKTLERLKIPFEKHQVHWRVGSTNAKKLGCKPWEATSGIALAYVDARDVMDRLDDVVGADCWQDSYQETTSGRVICTLKIKLGDVWIEKSDGAGDTGTEGEKGAISDAFKRAAVKFGIARYLYSLPNSWVPLEKGRFKNKPELPASHLPKARIDKEVIQKSLWAILSGIKNNDAGEIKETLDELSAQETDFVWRLLSSKQKAASKAILHTMKQEQAA
jgi:hypothetical protein